MERPAKLGEPSTASSNYFPLPNSPSLPQIPSPMSAGPADSGTIIVRNAGKETTKSLPPKRTKQNITRPRLGSLGGRPTLLDLDEGDHPRSRSRSHGDARLISSALRLVEQQTARAISVEQASKTEVDTLLSCARELTEGRIKAQMEVAGVRAELEMYKRQFAEAQRGGLLFLYNCST